MVISLTDNLFRLSKDRFQKKSRLQIKESKRPKVQFEKSTRGSATLTAELMTCGELKLKKREQRPVLPKSGSVSMRTSSPLSRIIGTVPKMTTENRKTRSRRKGSRFRTAKSD